MSYILSFDIGIKNLAYCYSQDAKIIKWNVFDIKGDNVNETCEKCVKVLSDTFRDDPIDQVLIENQPVQKNPTMKTIQIVVYTFFMYQKVGGVKQISNINFISANRKNKFADKFKIDIECKTKYQKNKKVAIACTKLLVENTEWDEHFNKHKKKDDLADSYLQTLAFINHDPVVKTTHDPVVKTTHDPVLPNPPAPLSEDDSSSTSSTSASDTFLSNS
jgi:hypothetical protein